MVEMYSVVANYVCLSNFNCCYSPSTCLQISPVHPVLTSVVLDGPSLRIAKSFVSCIELSFFFKITKKSSTYFETVCYLTEKET